MTLICSCALIAAACTNDTALDQPVTTTTETTVTTSQTTATTSSTTTTAETEAGTDGPAELWTEMWTAALTVADKRDAAYDALGTSIAPDIRTTLENLFQGEAPRTVTNNPVITNNSDGTIKIDDCINIFPTAIEKPANWYAGKAEPDNNGGWTITEVQLITASGCIPASLAEEILDDYQEFWDARVDYWNPANPDHPGVTATMTGTELERMTKLLTEDKQAGWYVQMGNETRHPEIADYDRADLVTIVDCQISDPDTGVFDANGVRQEGIPKTVPNQMDLTEVELTLEDGQWKVSKIFQLTNVQCDFAPTEEFGAPIV